MPTPEASAIDEPTTPLKQWFDADPKRHITVCAKQWGVSTLWLIAHGRVRASLEHAFKIVQHTGGAVTMADLCGPLDPKAKRNAKPKPAAVGAKRKPKPAAKPAKAKSTRSTGRAAASKRARTTTTTTSRRGRKAVAS
jgi:hypothetical protein